MKAVVWMRKKFVEVQRVADPILLNPRDCIVKITSTAICGSDIHPIFVEKRDQCIKVVLDAAA